MRFAEMWIAAYLLNALWQAPLVFVTACLLTRAVRACGAAWEQWVWVGALLVEVSLPAASMASRTWLQRFAWPHPGARTSAGHASVSVGVWRALQGIRLQGRGCAVLVTVCAVAWAYAGLRLLWRYRQTRRLQREASPVTLSGPPAELWAGICRRFGIEEAVVAESDRATGPLTCGIWRRWLLLPPGLLEELGEAELRTLFAHEAAHMRRRDFAKNLVYEMAAVVLAWHPAMWATRRRLAESREWVCDAIAAVVTGENRVYARSLLRLASLLSAAEPVPQSHALGLFEANALEERIMRVTERTKQTGWARRLVTVAACGLVTAGVCAPAWAWGAQAGMTQAEGAMPVRGGDMAGQIESRVDPVYPPEARAAGVQGTVLLDAVIGPDGHLAALKLVSGPPELTRAAWSAVSQWTWQPYLRNGQPTTVETSISVNFQLNP